MANLYPKFPYGVDDNMLKTAIKEYADEIFTKRADINVVLQLTPLLILGQNELQSRRNKRVTWFSFSISFLSLLVAGIALFVSLSGTRVSETWKNEQLQALTKMNADVNKQTNAIADILKSQTLAATEPSAAGKKRK